MRRALAGCRIALRRLFKLRRLAVKLRYPVVQHLRVRRLPGGLQRRRLRAQFFHLRANRFQPVRTFCKFQFRDERLHIVAGKPVLNLRVAETVRLEDHAGENAFHIQQLRKIFSELISRKCDRRRSREILHGHRRRRNRMTEHAPDIFPERSNLFPRIREAPFERRNACRRFGGNRPPRFQRRRPQFPVPRRRRLGRLRKHFQLFRRASAALRLRQCSARFKHRAPRRKRLTQLFRRQNLRALLLLRKRRLLHRADRRGIHRLRRRFHKFNNPAPRRTNQAKPLDNHIQSPDFHPERRKHLFVFGDHIHETFERLRRLRNQRSRLRRHLIQLARLLQFGDLRQKIVDRLRQSRNRLFTDACRKLVQFHLHAGPFAGKRFGLLFHQPRVLTALRGHLRKRLFQQCKGEFAFRTEFHDLFRAHSKHLRECLDNRHAALRELRQLLSLNLAFVRRFRVNRHHVLQGLLRSGGYVADHRQLLRKLLRGDSDVEQHPS